MGEPVEDGFSGDVGGSHVDVDFGGRFRGRGFGVGGRE